MKPIAVFYHCTFFNRSRQAPYPQAVPIISEQMSEMQESGLLDACSHMMAGVNGWCESLELAYQNLPAKARICFYGLRSRSENLTFVEIEKWVKDHPGWHVLYFHPKGLTHEAECGIATPWRRAMMRYCVANWRECVADLDSGFESVGCHFFRNHLDGTQNFWPGNFWWTTSDFLKEVPSILLRDRIKQSGIETDESRFEAEVWIGNGRVPKVKEYLPAGGEGVP